MHSKHDLLKYIAENPGVDAGYGASAEVQGWVTDLARDGMITRNRTGSDGWEATPKGLDELTTDPEHPELLLVDLDRLAVFCPHCNAWVSLFLGVGDRAALSCQGCHRPIAHTQFFK